MKTFTLFKRDQAGHQMAKDAIGFRDRPWYAKFCFRGVNYLRCLQTTDSGIAQARARALYKEITDAIIRGQYDRLDGTKTRHAVIATLGELIAAYRRSPVDAKYGTRESNINSLVNIMKKTRGAERDALLQTPYPALLTAETAAAHFSAYASQAAAGPDQESAARSKRTANSLWLQASSLCAPRALAFYKTLGMFHPCLDDFLNAGTLHRFTRLPRICYNPPADEVIAATLGAWELLEDRNLFLAIGLELAFGLRVGEVAQARSGWFNYRQGYPVLDGTAQVKNGTGLIQVRALDPFYTTLRTKATARGWLNLDHDELLITGSDSFRSDGIERAVSAFLRTHGWTTRKTNHALRAYAGSQIAMKYGIYEAQTWLRHSSVKVTEGHYSHFIHKFKPANPENLTARWATLETVEKETEHA
jgi:integrase